MTCQIKYPSKCPDIVCDRVAQSNKRFYCDDLYSRKYSKTACRLTYLGKNLLNSEKSYIGHIWKLLHSRIATLFI